MYEIEATPGMSTTNKGVVNRESVYLCVEDCDTYKQQMITGYRHSLGNGATGSLIAKLYVNGSYHSKYSINLEETANGKIWFQHLVDPTAGFTEDNDSVVQVKVPSGSTFKLETQVSGRIPEAANFRSCFSGSVSGSGRLRETTDEFGVTCGAPG